MSKITEEFKAFGNFMRECRVELGKISWPNRKELVGSTWVVCGLILILSLFVFFSDQILTRVIDAITR